MNGWRQTQVPGVLIISFVWALSVSSPKWRRSQRAELGKGDSEQSPSFSEEAYTWVSSPSRMSAPNEESGCAHLFPTPPQPHQELATHQPTLPEGSQRGAIFPAHSFETSGYTGFSGSYDETMCREPPALYAQDHPGTPAGHAPQPLSSRQNSSSTYLALATPVLPPITHLWESSATPPSPQMEG